MLPAIFVSHGSPMLAIEDAPARRFLQSLPDLLPERPKAILMVSAHWERLRPGLTAPPRNETIHDFGGFPQALFDIQYPAPPAPDVARRAATILANAGFEVDIDQRRGLDHGAWVPLTLAWPGADIPVTQLSVQTRLGPKHHYDLGKLLAPLRAEGVLIIGSGSYTHDLSRFRISGGVADAPEQADVRAFSEWMSKAIAENRVDDLINYRTRAPDAARNHPTEEHLLPLYAALGAGDGKVEHLHGSVMYGFLRMDAFAFH
jgi:4,5-DOPA dioxygenase extradiol